MASEIEALIERLESAARPDTALDLALLHLWQPEHEALRQYGDRYETETRDGVFAVKSRDGGYFSSVPFPRFTASVDAAIAHARLPGAKRAYVLEGGPFRKIPFEGGSHSPAIALCIALLEAIKTIEANHD